MITFEEFTEDMEFLASIQTLLGIGAPADLVAELLECCYLVYLGTIAPKPITLVPCAVLCAPVFHTRKVLVGLVRSGRGTLVGACRCGKRTLTST
jgi:hypothetical protein